MQSKSRHKECTKIKLVIICFHPQHGSNVLLWPFLLEVRGCRQDKCALDDFLSKPDFEVSSVDSSSNTE
jgi:hypothetical protein